ncbi:MAG: hypothetical protein EPN94_08240 [Nitrospirae bacterium]|nr:MAG: hypothetical protein EPN94_08240 [Nitrospirota bacterium]
MTRAHRHSGVFSFVLIPLAVALILFGIFSIVWLRSGVRTVEYSIAQLDNKRMAALKERKMLMAERASLLSLQNVKGASDEKLGLVFPDRVKVIYVKKERGLAPYKASLAGNNLQQEGRRLSEP